MRNVIENARATCALSHMRSGRYQFHWHGRLALETWPSLAAPTTRIWARFHEARTFLRAIEIEVALRHASPQSAAKIDLASSKICEGMPALSADGTQIMAQMKTATPRANIIRAAYQKIDPNK